MNTIFISGSRNILALNQEVRERLHNILSQRFNIVVGDANGADKAVQQYLVDERYPYVTVYCAGNTCRNNVGNWRVSKIQVDPKLTGRNFYTTKDKKMAEIADYGFVLWDGKSPGSYNNIIELLKRNKKALVYFSPERVFFTAVKLDDAQSLLSKCDALSQAKIKKKMSPFTQTKEAAAQAEFNV